MTSPFMLKFKTIISLFSQSLNSLMQIYPLALNTISVCWITFAVIWLLAALWTRRSVYRESKAQRLRYTIPIVLGGLLVAKGQRLPDPLNHRVIPPLDTLDWTGLSYASPAWLSVSGPGLPLGAIGAV